MTRALALSCAVLALLLWLSAWFFLPAHAAGNAPGAALWPPEPRYEATVIELATIAPLFRRCDLDPCGDYYQRKPDPAPVPLPWPGLLLTAAIAAMIWKGSNRV